LSRFSFGFGSGAEQARELVDVLQLVEPEHELDGFSPVMEPRSYHKRAGLAKSPCAHCPFDGARPLRNLPLESALA